MFELNNIKRRIPRCIIIEYVNDKRYINVVRF